ncbi:ABC transporter ATP-binding protein [Asaia bogorensis]|uniref:ABC transporter n=1 Tax=Asaia bogorensis NBRC 16594 TaxID=1231624 RepID=A0AAN4R335_9PROT|nr:ABC transporter ATP-binding protein [Asaia bogorensis]BAT19082.1 ABC transporter [Asaia bogorensis NBRC 16594]GBQ73265.1 ABC transporter ATP-binding protein [Asaia bogorensis NBRC 16594]GEL53438.1 ABC transporter [Asaia bogorensis NBRC 16594]
MFPVVIESLSKNYGAKRVLDQVSLTLEPGSITALLGPNGAGKTTLIGCLLGLLQPDSGSIRVWGQSADALTPSLRERIGFVPQTMTGLTWFRVQELLDYLAAFHNSQPRADAGSTTQPCEDKSWSQWASLDPKSRISALSGGERQRLAIVLALRFSPDLIVLDEPVASLDPLARHDFIALLAETVKQRGATVLLSSHIISDLERICDRFVTLNKGQIISTVDSCQFNSHIRHLAQWPDAHHGLRVLVDLPDGSVWVEGWTPAHEALGLTVLPGDLEAFFLALTR